MQGKYKFPSSRMYVTFAVLLPLCILIILLWVIRPSENPTLKKWFVLGISILVIGFWTFIVINRYKKKQTIMHSAKVINRFFTGSLVNRRLYRILWSKVYIFVEIAYSRTYYYGDMRNGLFDHSRRTTNTNS